MLRHCPGEPEVSLGASNQRLHRTVPFTDPGLLFPMHSQVRLWAAQRHTCKWNDAVVFSGHLATYPLLPIIENKVRAMTSSIECCTSYKDEDREERNGIDPRLEIGGVARFGCPIVIDPRSHTPR